MGEFIEVDTPRQMRPSMHWIPLGRPLHSQVAGAALELRQRSCKGGTEGKDFTFASLSANEAAVNTVLMASLWICVVCVNREGRTSFFWKYL